MADEALSDMDLENFDLNDIKPGDLKQARDKLLQMLNDESLSEDARENLKTLLGGDLPVFGATAGSSGTLLGLTFAILIFAIIFDIIGMINFSLSLGVDLLTRVFFGYKLYKSIKSKEMKRNEKKRAKQMKKTK